MAQTRSITCLLLGRIGDAITATPFLDTVKKRYPGARLRLVMSAACRGLGELIAADDFAWVYSADALAALREKTDVLIDLNPAPSKSAAALMWLGRADEKLGFRKPRLNAVFTRQIAEAREDEPMLERYRRLAEALDARDYHPMPRLIVGDEKARARALLEPLGFSAGQRALLLHPGNFKKFDNRWPEEKFVALADRLLAETDLTLYFLAGPGEQSPVQAIAQACKKPVAVVAPATLRETSGVLQNMTAFLCNVTGTTHLAHAVGAPTFALYSGYTNAVWRPAAPLCEGVISKEWESCRSLEVDDVFAGLRQFLARLTTK